MLTPEPTENAASFEDFLKAVEPRLKRLLAVYRIPGDDAEDVLSRPCSPCSISGSGCATPRAGCSARSGGTA